MGDLALGASTVASVRLPDGVRLHTEIHGGRAEAQTPTIVLLHGWTLDHRLWHQQIVDIPKRIGGPVRLVAFDLRGHGRSTPTPLGTATLTQLADDLAAVIRKKVPTGPIILVGHSLGGMAILEYAHRHHETFTQRVAGVVLVSTSAEGAAHTMYGLNPNLARVVRMVEVSSAGVLARFGPWRMHRPLMPVLGPGVRWLVFGQEAQDDWVRLTISMVGSASLRAIGGFRPSVAVHHRVDALAAMSEVPVAILVGSRDRLTPVRCSETIAAELPHAVHQICAGAGHMLPLECPDDVTDAIVQVCRQASQVV
ncbi:MAG TPA: alpha/beta hydrolase [Micromonosporaceae bacterium]|nr:alpha/beta hydrolase [Micromonosporaceae bacterium]